MKKDRNYKNVSKFFQIQKTVRDHERKVLKLSSGARKVFGIVHNDDLHIRMTINHDTGKSCFEAKVLLKKL